MGVRERSETELSTHSTTYLDVIEIEAEVDEDIADLVSVRDDLRSRHENRTHRYAFHSG